MKIGKFSHPELCLKLIVVDHPSLKCFHNNRTRRLAVRQKAALNSHWHVCCFSPPPHQSQSVKREHRKEPSQGLRKPDSIETPPVPPEVNIHQPDRFEHSAATALRVIRPIVKPPDGLIQKVVHVGPRFGTETVLGGSETRE
jgi:hypothetical protein